MSHLLDPSDPAQLAAGIGQIDLYLLDLLLRGAVSPGARVIDVGCGGGRNLEYFLRGNYAVSALDPDLEACRNVEDLARRSGRDDCDVRQESIESCSFQDHSFDLVVCNAVLHFLPSRQEFDRAVERLARLARPSGIVFARLATTFALESELVPLPEPREKGWFRLPDESERFLVSTSDLIELTAKHAAGMMPLKTVHVHGKRSMTTWIWETRS